MNSSMRRAADFLYRHGVLAFALMGLFFMLFGVTTVDLFFLFSANLRLFAEYDWLMVIEDGALQQLLELVGVALIAVASLVAFVICERILVRRLLARWQAARAR